MLYFGICVASYSIGTLVQLFKPLKRAKAHSAFQQAFTDMFYSALPYSKEARPAQKWEWHILSDYKYESFVVISSFSVAAKKE